MNGFHFFMISTKINVGTYMRAFCKYVHKLDFSLWNIHTIQLHNVIIISGLKV